jgi:hypothetical protein
MGDKGWRTAVTATLGGRFSPFLGVVLSSSMMALVVKVFPVPADPVKKTRTKGDRSNGHQRYSPGELSGPRVHERTTLPTQNSGEDPLMLGRFEAGSEFDDWSL